MRIELSDECIVARKECLPQLRLAMSFGVLRTTSPRRIARYDVPAKRSSSVEVVGSSRGPIPRPEFSHANFFAGALFAVAFSFPRLRRGLLGFNPKPRHVHRRRAAGPSPFTRRSPASPGSSSSRRTAMTSSAATESRCGSGRWAATSTASRRRSWTSMPVPGKRA